MSEIYQKYSKIVFFDTETTGFDPKADQMIELACLVWNGPRQMVEYDKFIQLEHVKELPQKIQDLTGILPHELATGISEKQAAEDFDKFCQPDPGGKVLLVAHNAQFDLSFMGHTMMRHMTEDPKDKTRLIRNFAQADYLDTLTVYKDRAGYPHKLKDAITHYGLDDKVQNTHRAIDDAKALAAVFDAMEDERSDLDEYVNIFGYNDRYGVNGPIFKKVKYYSQSFGFGLKGPEQTLPRLENKTEWRQR